MLCLIFQITGRSLFLVTGLPFFLLEHADHLIEGFFYLLRAELPVLLQIIIDPLFRGGFRSLFIQIAADQLHACLGDHAIYYPVGIKFRLFGPVFSEELLLSPLPSDYSFRIGLKRLIRLYPSLFDLPQPLHGGHGQILIPYRQIIRRGNDLYPVFIRFSDPVKACKLRGKLAGIISLRRLPLRELMRKQLRIAKQTHSFSKGSQKIFIGGKFKILRGFRHQLCSDILFIEFVPLALPFVSLCDMLYQSGGCR